MMQNLTRPRLIQIWFVAVLLVAAAGLAYGVAMTVGTGALLLALCLVPPAIILMVWRVPPDTVAEVLHDAERRG
jgi:hypothetical protein